MIFRKGIGRMLCQALIIILAQAAVFALAGAQALGAADLFVIVPRELLYLIPRGNSVELINLATRISYFVSCLALVIFGALSLAKDSADGRMEFLLVRPFTRMEIFFSRMALGLITVVISCAALFGLWYLTAYLVLPEITAVEIRDILYFSLRAMGIKAMFWTVSFMWSSMCRIRTSAVCASLICFFGTYTLGVFPHINEVLSIASYMSPFHFAFEMALEWIRPTIAGAIAAISLAAGIVAFRRGQFYEL
ncbi:MAG: hypothetical protein GX633_09850 [Clostridiales bacterium]|nr:hypothetical protein [Clostridiales bacterium]